MICETDFGSFWSLLIDLLADSETLCLFHGINVHLHVDTKISMTPDSQKLIQSPGSRSHNQCLSRFFLNRHNLRFFLIAPCMHCMIAHMDYR